MKLAQAGWRFAYIDKQLARYRWPAPERGQSYDRPRAERDELKMYAGFVLRHPLHAGAAAPGARALAPAAAPAARGAPPPVSPRLTYTARHVASHERIAHGCRRQHRRRDGRGLRRRVEPLRPVRAVRGRAPRDSSSSTSRVFPWDALPDDADGLRPRLRLGPLGARSSRRASGRCTASTRAPRRSAVARRDARRPAELRVPRRERRRAAVRRRLDGLRLLARRACTTCPTPPRRCASAVRPLKPGAPFLVYLYYAFDNQPAWYRALWRATDLVRRVMSRSPVAVKVAVTSAIAARRVPAARAARARARRGRAATSSALPLSFYRDRSFYTMRTDAFDRFAHAPRAALHRRRDPLDDGGGGPDRHRRLAGAAVLVRRRAPGGLTVAGDAAARAGAGPARHRADEPRRARLPREPAERADGPGALRDAASSAAACRRARSPPPTSPSATARGSRARST